MQGIEIRNGGADPLVPFRSRPFRVKAMEKIEHTPEALTLIT